MSAAITDTNEPATLLLIDDEQNIIASLRRTLRADGYRILTANDGLSALQMLNENVVDVIVADQRMPQMSGVEFLGRVKNAQPDTIRIVLSGYTDLKTVIDAVNAGAIYKFLTKPWNDEQLRLNIAEAVRHKRLSDENRKLANVLEDRNRELASANKQLAQLLERAHQQLEIDGTALDVAHDILDSLPVPVIGIDSDGLIAFANICAENTLGSSRPLLCGQIDEVLPSPLQTLIKAPCTKPCKVSVHAHGYNAYISTLGDRSKGRGLLLVLIPEDLRHD